MLEVTSGLKFPEGPIAMPDGSVILVEIARGTLSRVAPDGKIEIIAETGGGPNGAALGPDGAVYICNNGGFEWYESNGLLFAGDIAADYSGGRIERVDIATGKVDVLYTECEGNRCVGLMILFSTSKAVFGSPIWARAMGGKKTAALFMPRLTAHTSKKWFSRLRPPMVWASARMRILFMSLKRKARVCGNGNWQDRASWSEAAPDRKTLSPRCGLQLSILWR